MTGEPYEQLELPAELVELITAPERFRRLLDAEIEPDENGIVTIEVAAD